MTFLEWLAGLFFSGKYTELEAKDAQRDYDFKEAWKDYERTKRLRAHASYRMHGRRAIKPEDN